MRRLSVPLLAAILSLSRVVSAQTCPLPSAAITFGGSADDGYVCGGLTLGASVPDAGEGATYEWSVSGSDVAISSGQGTRAVTVTTKNLLTNPSHGISVTVTNACGTTSSQRTFNTIQVFDTYEVSFTPSPVTIGVGPVGCVNSAYQASLSFLPRMLMPPPERTWAWTIDDGTITSPDHGASIDFQSGSPGTLHWSVIQQDRCSSLGDYHVHSGSFLLARPIETSPTVVAPSRVSPGSTGNTANLSNLQELFQSGEIRVSDFFWSITNGTLQGNVSQLPAVFTAGASGDLTITAHLSDFCGHTYTPSATIRIADPDVAISAPDRVCSKEMTIASVSPIAGASYNWTVSGGSITGGQGTPSIMLMPLASPMVVSVNVNTFSASKSIEVVASPDATITSSSPVAADSTAAASVADAGPGATYQWSIANGTISGPANGREVAYVAGDHGQVALDVIVTAATGCTASASFTASIQCPTRPAPLNLMIAYHGVTSGCSESNGRLCAPHEEILLSVSSEGTPVDDCDDVTWTYGTSHANGAKVSVHLDAPGTYAIAVDVRNPVGSAAAETKIGIGADRRRAARH